jgi:hypothetical protein
MFSKGAASARDGSLPGLFAFQLSGGVSPMSDAPFGSPDSEAAWTALGNRMRKNRMWLLLMFVALGLYLAAQSWARLRRDGFDVDALARGVSLTSSSTEAATPTSPLGATGGERENLTPRSLQETSTPSKASTSTSVSTPAAAPQMSEAQAARARTREITAGRGQEASRNSPDPSLTEHRAPGSDTAPVATASKPSGAGAAQPAPAQGSAAARSAMTNQGTALTTHPAGPTGGSTRGGVTPQQPSEIEAMGESIGQWVAQWQHQREDSRREGLRIAASAVARFARRPRPSSVGPVAESLPAAAKGAATTEGAATAEGTPSNVQATHAAGPVITEPTARETPQLPQPRHSGLSIYNPSRSGGAVHYLVNGQAHTLRPGESQELPTGRWLIEFHRGGDYGDATSTLAGGSYRFEITRSGWQLLRGE